MTDDATRGAGRRVHWLELFFDLVMVAYIGQIAHTMHGDPGWLQAGAFFGLLAAAWWAWVNASLTMNLFGARVTPSIWISVTIAMGAIGVMAAAVPDAFSDRAAAFAIGNAVIRLVWSVPWFAKRASIGVPLWRPVLYSVVPAAIWVASVFVPPPTQFLLWVLAVAIEVALLGALGSQAEWLRATLDVDHLLERISLLVVIVFGESILSIIIEFDEHWAPLPAFTAVLGLLAVSVLAWIFFGYGTVAAERELRSLQRRGSISGLRDTMMYLPFLFIAGIALFAAGLGTAVAEAGHHLPVGAAVCLAAGVSLFFVACAAESLRYGVAWADVVLWGPAGVLLPWALVPLSEQVDATAVVAASVILLALLTGLSEINARRVRARRAAVTTT